MNTPAKNDIYLASGSTHRVLAEQIAQAMDIELHSDDAKIFPSGERYFRYCDSIRGKHALLVQSLVSSPSGSVNDSLIELLLMIDAARRGSAREITVITPYMAYMRQDRKARGREPISAAAVINMLQTTGAHRLVSIDMHSAQTQAVFDGPFDHLIAGTLLEAALADVIGDSKDSFVIVSPDGGRAKMAESYAEALHVDLVHIPKSRSKTDSSTLLRPKHVEGVDGKVCILIDDMIDTAGTLVSAAETLASSGASGIIAAATHAILSGPAIERIEASPITSLLVTDTTPVEAFKDTLGDRLTIIPAAPMIAAALEAIVEGGSVSEIFRGKNYV